MRELSAENLGRQWIGIDVSPTACRVMAKRLRDVCVMKEDEKLWRIGAAQEKMVSANQDTAGDVIYRYVTGLTAGV